MHRPPGLAGFSIESLIAPTPGPRLLAGGPLMYGGYVLLPGALPLPTPGLGLGDVPSLPVALPSTGSPTDSTQSGLGPLGLLSLPLPVSQAGSNSTESPSDSEPQSPSVLSRASAFQSRIPASNTGLLQPAHQLGSPHNRGSGGGLKPVPGPHPNSAQPLPAPGAMGPGRGDSESVSPPGPRPPLSGSGSRALPGLALTVPSLHPAHPAHLSHPSHPGHPSHSISAPHDLSHTAMYTSSHGGESYSIIEPSPLYSMISFSFFSGS